MSANYVNEGYTTYGSGPCPACGARHALDAQIPENSKARFIAMRVIAELSMVPTRNQGAATWQNGKSKEEKLASLRSRFMGQVNDTHLYVLEFVHGSTALTLAPTSTNLKELAARGGAYPEKQVAAALKDLVRNRLVTDQGGYLRANDPMMPTVESGKNKQFMLGVLVAGRKIFLAASGRNLSRLKGAAPKLSRSLGEPVICKERLATDTNRTFAGRVIPAKEYTGTQVDNEPGTCAAPRLIQQAFEDAAAVRVRRDWQMTEVWYDPRSDADESYHHGLSALHCRTCARLVPLLLCPRAAG